jgi:hypothetical protein
VAEEVTPSFATRKATIPFHGTVEINTFPASGFRGGEFRVVEPLLNARFHYAISKHIVSRDNFV